MFSRQNTVGRAEKISFPHLNLKNVPAKIDTGADSSSIWATDIRRSVGELSCVLFAPGNPFYTGERLTFKEQDVSVTRIGSSFGHRELRYKVKLAIELKGHRFKTDFTLADRSTKLYPILIGRNTLKGRFLVDVSKGGPLRAKEAIRKKRLQSEMKKLKKELDNENRNLI